MCLGTKQQEHTPVKLPLTNVTLATGAGGHASLLAGGHLYSCGQNQFGQLGDGTLHGTTTPRQISTAAPVVELDSGYGFTGALLSDGTYWDWGQNQEGQLGIGTTTSEQHAPQGAYGKECRHLSTVGANDHKDGQTFVILANGDLMAWGDDNDGQLCDRHKKPAVTSPRPSNPRGLRWLRPPAAARRAFS